MKRNKVKLLLFLLLRDEIQFGKIESIMKIVDKHGDEYDATFPDNPNMIRIMEYIDGLVERLEV